MTTLKVAELIEDFALYPRSSVDSSHVADMAHALEAGGTLPPVVIDKTSKRIVDGFHRRRALMRVYGNDTDIEVELREYASDSELYLDALRLNAHHAKKISGADRTHAIIVGADIGVSPSAIAEAFGVTVDHVEMVLSIKTGKVTYRGAKGKAVKARRVPLKNSVKHLWGTQPNLNQEQERVMKSAPGQSQWLLVKQLADLIEFGLFDWGDERAMKEIKRLEIVMSDAAKVAS
ncbi:MAG: ParB/RepB/Spo0J family partition protein [Planctomycetota bacterium]|nr:ParB/RepB/Spo0J family partition protein [Planctomycetota bacterium]